MPRLRLLFDEHVWHSARERDCVLVTRDGDFHPLSVLRGAPPKVVWIRLGNCGTAEVAAVLRRHVNMLEAAAAARTLSGT